LDFSSSAGWPSAARKRGWNRRLRRLAQIRNLDQRRSARSAVKPLGFFFFRRLAISGKKRKMEPQITQIHADKKSGSAEISAISG